MHWALCGRPIAEACARTVQSNFSGGAGGNARITYSPGTIEHFLKSYGALLDCEDTIGRIGFDADPTDEQSNFSLCFSREFPTNAVLMKAHWIRADFGEKCPCTIPMRKHSRL